MEERPHHLPAPPPRRQRRGMRVALTALFVGLVLVVCIAVALIPFFAGAGRPSQADPFQVVFAALFTLLGLLLAFTERQIRRRGRPHAVAPFFKLLFTSVSGLTFWIGLALVGIAVARLETPPGVAGPLNNVFWAVVGLWLLLQLLFNGRRLMRPRRARAPGRNDV